MIQEEIYATGEVKIKLINEYGIVIQTRHIDNLVTTIGKGHIAGLMSAIIPTAMSDIAVGTGTNTQTIADTSLQSEIGTRSTATKTNTTPNVIVYVATFAAGNATGALSEAGIFNSATTNSGTMLARTTFPTVNKGSGDTIVVTWSITIS